MSAGITDRLRAAGHDDRLSSGALYLEAAERIQELEGVLRLVKMNAAHCDHECHVAFECRAATVDRGSWCAWCLATDALTGGVPS